MADQRVQIATPATLRLLFHLSLGWPVAARSARNSPALASSDNASALTVGFTFDFSSADFKAAGS
jgi:hypothetical protein